MARVLVGPVLLGLAALSACTSSAEPAPLPSPSTSSSAPAPSPSATPPSLPPAASGTSPAAAKAFARHYFDSINYAAATGDTDELRALGAEDCVSCEAIASNIEKVYQAGGHIEGENWGLRSVVVLKAGNGKAVMALGAVIAPEMIVRGDGTRERHAGGKQPMTMFIDQTGGRATVAKLDLAT